MMPYLVGQVCRYVLRFRGKNGKEDLDKAGHFLQKLKEVYYPEVQVTKLIPGRLLYDLVNECEDELGRHVLNNAMLHVGGWYSINYTHSALADFFNAI